VINAGFGLRGALVTMDLGAIHEMNQVNIVALTALTRLLLPPMLERRRGRVLNVASTASYVPGPMMAVYYASKSYVLSFSGALANELGGTGVNSYSPMSRPYSDRFQRAGKCRRRQAVPQGRHERRGRRARRLRRT
jgi:short-subunit dehydrogenase